MDKRLFVGITLPPEHVQALAACGRLTAGIRPDSRAVAADNLHVTVCFLGDVAEFDLAPLRETLRSTIAGIKPFTMSFVAVRNAPPASREFPSMVWASYEGKWQFAEAVRVVHDAVAPFAPEMPPPKAALPHVTLVRFSTRRARPEPPPPPPLPPFEVREFHLFESDLRPEGASYTRLEDYPLAV